MSADRVTVAALSALWRDSFSQFVTLAAGRDRKLSSAEMARATRTLPSEMQGLGATAALLLGAGRGADRDKLIADGVARAQDLFVKAGGADRWLSRRDTRSLPPDLRASVDALRRELASDKSALMAAQARLDARIKAVGDGGSLDDNGTALLSTRVLSQPMTLEQLRMHLQREAISTWTESFDGTWISSRSRDGASADFVDRIRACTEGIIESGTNAAALERLLAAVDAETRSTAFSSAAFITTSAIGPQYNADRYTLALQAPDRHWLLVELYLAG